jgi:serine/threonine protein kinase
LHGVDHAHPRPDAGAFDVARDGERQPLLDVARFLGSLSSAANALVMMSDDLDDALAPRGANLDVSATERPRWLVVGEVGRQETQPETPRAREAWTQLVPSLGSLLSRHVFALQERGRRFATFDPKPGARFGDFELIEKLGVGGMGEVWRASLQGVRQVALKIPRVDVGHGHRERLRRIMQAEATTMYRLQFSRVATLLSAGVIGTTPYLATVLIRGRGLDEHLIYDDDADPSGKHLPIVRRVFNDVCIGLDNLHRHGLVHRDLKPSNVMLRMRGTDKDPIKTIGQDPKGREIDDALLIDFGIAHEFNALAAHGATPGYAAPEVVNDGPVGPAADLYALGATLYHVLTGQPVTGERTDIDAFLWHDEVEPESDPDVRQLAGELPSSVREAILGSTRRDPLRRISLDDFRSLVGEV